MSAMDSEVKNFMELDSFLNKSWCWSRELGIEKVESILLKNVRYLGEKLSESVTSKTNLIPL